MNSPKKPPQSRAVDKPASNAWQGNAARPKAAPGAKPRPPTRPVKKAEPWEVTPESLSCLDAVRSLLTALNNAYVSTHQIQKLILDIPVLAARCMRRVGNKQAATAETLAQALTSMGNMGLENELLGLLEDLTTCRADLLEAQAAAAAEETDPAS